jgi:hypothetical protein
MRLSSTKKLEHPNAEWGLRNAEFKTFKKKYLLMLIVDWEIGI